MAWRQHPHYCLAEIVQLYSPGGDRMYPRLMHGSLGLHKSIPHLSVASSALLVLRKPVYVYQQTSNVVLATNKSIVDIKLRPSATYW